ncbi:MAG: M15 family metallopeptidase [Lachnospiraceae bacterium]|nr:M15 family metallopeptidase [Lachnospiraceae bacterium]
MSEQPKRKRLSPEERRIQREQELRRRLLIGGGIALAVLVLLILVVSLLRGRGKTKNEPAAAGTVQQEVTAQSTGMQVTVLSQQEAASSEAESAASLPEAAESAAEEALPTAVPIDQQEAKEANLSVDWKLVLVNPKNTLTNEFYVDVEPLQYDSEYYFDARAVDALDRMLYDCEAAGYSPVVRAGYRSWSSQNGLYQNKIDEYVEDEGYSREEAKEIAGTIVAVPGTSEHQLGLACDIVSDGYPKMNYTQGDAPTQQWLTAHCAEYGFILRFPEGKSELTGIIWEGWHYRYVGKEAAAEIMERGLCLEEYLAEKGIG